MQCTKSGTRHEVSMPEVLRGPRLGIMPELLVCLACLAVAWGLELLAHLRWGDLVVF